ncbi:hypothetical protein [Nostoc sp.]
MQKIKNKSYLLRLMGIAFEPWHWRYIGSANAATVFANARNR